MGLHPEEKNHLSVPNPVPEIHAGLYELIGVFCGPIAPGRKGLVISWPPPHGWDGTKFNRINMVLNDENFEVLARAIIKAWKDWKGE